MIEGVYSAHGYALLKFEPHLHTLHSDGADSVAAMFEACQAAGYDAVALTDHNTLSGLPEAIEAAARLGLVVVPGVEVTTFRGHALALGVQRVPEWRDLEARGMDALAAEVRAQDGVLSVCHPAALGSPYCSGCAWEWPIAPSAVDMWEVFNDPGPEVPLALWRKLLQAGGHVAPVAAGAVHSVAEAARPRQTTYLYARERSAAGVLEALRHLRVTASLSSPLEFWLEEEASGATALVGSRVAEARWNARLAGTGEVESVSLADGARCVYAARRDAQGGLEAVSAPIWIETSQYADASV